MDYPFRLVWFDEYNAEVMISTVILSNQLFSSEGTWSDSLAEYIDNKIIYYVDEGEIIESDNYLQQLLKKIYYDKIPIFSSLSRRDG